MRRLFFVVLLFAVGVDAQQYSARKIDSFTGVNNGVSVRLIGSATNYSKISWNIVGGTLSACTIKLDQSADDVSYSALIAGQACTSNGASAVVAGTPNYVRMATETAFTVASGTPTLWVTFTGYTVDPTPGGGGTPGGADTQVQFNDAGAFGGDAGLTYNKTTNALTNTGGQFASTQGTLTTSLPFINHSVTFNGGAVQFIGYDSICTNTAAATTSACARWRVGTNRTWEILAGSSGTLIGALRFTGTTGATWHMFEEAGGAFISKFTASGAVTNHVDQCDPGAIDIRCYRRGLIQSGAYDEYGGADLAAYGGDAFIIRNINADNSGKVGLGALIAADVAAAGFDILMLDRVTATAVQIRSGPTQGTTDLLTFRNNANNLTLSSISETGRFNAGGNSVNTSDFAISAGWGTTASVSAASGRDQVTNVTITSAGTGQAANPTITWTWGDGTWTAPPKCHTQQVAGTGALADVTISSVSGTVLVLIWNATPVAALTYEFIISCMGIS